ncbi:MAG: CCA tRNA nucleotidyltransferase [Bacilli bacterium]
MKLPSDVKFILDKIREYGYISFVVGGAVRDYLLGNKPTDFDISTSSPPEITKEIFKDFKTIDNGIKHGTVMVIINHRMYEITTFRSEATYEKYRKPKNVTFISDLYTDLSRRDFTINAICFYDKIYDYFDGQADIEKGIIRTVNDPMVRFEEDALRILRAIRFSCQLDFSIDNKTKNAIFKKKNNLSFISKERINIEIKKMFDGNIYRLRNFYSVFKIFIPSLKKKDFIFSIKMMKKEYSLELNLSLLLMNCFDAKEIISELKFSKQVSMMVLSIIETKNLDINDRIYDFRLLFNKYNYDTVIDILNFHHILYNKDYSFKLINNAFNSCFSIKQLQINGHDLIDLKITKNKRALILNEVLDLVMKDKLENNKEVLLNYIKEKSTE